MVITTETNRMIETVNKETGELEVQTNYISVTHTEKNSEQSYVKLYLDHLAVLNGTNLSINPILAELLKKMTYANDEEPHQVIINSYVKKCIAKKLGYKNINTINNAITDFVKAGYIKRIARGAYEMNPNYFGKGDWSHIKKLRASYDYINGEFSFEFESETN